MKIHARVKKRKIKVFKSLEHIPYQNGMSWPIYSVTAAVDLVHNIFYNKFSFLKGELAYLISFKYITIYNQKDANHSSFLAYSGCPDCLQLSNIPSVYS